MVFCLSYSLQQGESFQGKFNKETNCLHFARYLCFVWHILWFSFGYFTWKPGTTHKDTQKYIYNTDTESFPDKLLWGNINAGEWAMRITIIQCNKFHCIKSSLNLLSQWTASHIQNVESKQRDFCVLELNLNIIRTYTLQKEKHRETGMVYNWEICLEIVFSYNSQINIRCLPCDYMRECVYFWCDILCFN